MVIAAFLITFREALEAALIIAIIVAYLTKINKNGAKKYVWIGSAAAILLSFAIGILVFIFFGKLGDLAESAFEGCASILATIVLTAMIFWMARNSRNMKEHLQKKIDTFISKKYLIGIASIAFIAIFREGIETVLFLTALYGIDFAGTFIGMAGGLLIVVAISYLLLKGTVRLPLQKFFKYTSIILIVFAAGLLGYGIHELMDAGEGIGVNFGFWGQHAYDINPADEKNPLHEDVAIGSVLRGLVGYDGNPEILRVVVYLAYWIVIGGYFFKTYKGFSFRDYLGLRKQPFTVIKPIASHLKK